MRGRLAIETSALSKDYGANRALDAVELEIVSGEVFALLGPNGAGKTTLVEILEGYRRRTSGDVRVLGIDPQLARAGWRARVGIVLQSTAVFDELSVEEIIAHFAGFYPRPMSSARVIELVGLEDKRQARCRTLSGGQRRRVDVALALVGDPDLIFLDEPTTGFDPGARRQAWDVVRGLTALGKTIVLTTHYLDEAEALADRVGVLISGRLLEVGTPAAIGGRATALTRVSFSREGRLMDAQIPRLTGSVRPNGSSITIETSTPTQVIRELADWARAYGVDELPELNISRPSLEDAYLAMVQASSDAAAVGGAT